MSRIRITFIALLSGALAAACGSPTANQMETAHPMPTEQTMTTDQQNRAAFHNILDKALNGHDPNVLDTALTPDSVDHDLPPGTPRGPAGTKAKLGAFIAAFPDLHFTFEDEVYQGDKVSGRGYFTGTHKGTFNGIPATGKQVKVRFMDLWRFENGKLAEYWGQPDVLGLLQQIGAIPTT